jgi:hypothetical protein
MTGTRSYPGPDAARLRLRLTLATIERELSRLPTLPVSDLRAAVRDLFEQLALGPDLEMRRCLACQQFSPRARASCGHCGTKLDPPPAAPAALQA